MKAVQKQILIATFILAFSSMILEGCTGRRKVVTIGSKSFSEQYIISSMMTLLLEKNGFYVRERFGTGSMITRMGLITGQIDLYAEYTGTAWTLYLKHNEKINDPAKLYSLVKEEDWKKHRLRWLFKIGVDNTYALAVRKKDIPRFGKNLSTLAQHITSSKKQVRFGIAHEFYKRPDGFKAMLKAYNMKIPESQIKTMDIGLTYESINRDQIDVAMVYSTDGKLTRFKLKVLEDDRGFFPIYSLCVVARDAIIKKYPGITAALAPLAGMLDNKTMQQLNYQVDVLGKPARMVAHDFLKSKGLVQ